MKSSLKYSLLAAGLMVAAMSGKAATLCTDPSIAGHDILSIPNLSCSVDGLTFSNFNVSGATLSIDSVTTGVTGPEVDLGFQISNLLSGNDIHLTYLVTGGITGIDAHLTAISQGGSVTIGETACDAQFVQDVCQGNILGSFTVTSSGQSADGKALFSLTNAVYLDKDIEFNNTEGSVFLSHFVNSQLTGVPEPMTLSLMGAGLLGIGLLGRRLKRK